MLRRTFIKLAATGSVGMCLPTLASTSPNALTATADLKRHSVTLTRADGGKRVIGGLGLTPGSFNAPRAAVVAGERVFVLDSGNSRVQVFDLDGNFVRVFGRFGRGRGELAYPGAMVADADGTIIVADTLNHRLVRYREDGTIVACITGGMNGPRALRVDVDGDLHVTDSECTMKVCGLGAA